MLKSGVSLAAVGGALLATSAQAQDAATPGAPAISLAAADTGGIGEIVVTAQRRSENLQKVPISVTAVTSEKLASAGVLTLDQLPAVAPGVVVQQTFGAVNVFLRGIGAIQSGFTAESPVAIYIDGIYVPNAAASAFGLNDIARIEVLKGPQGTLFGRNAVGGLINVVTRDPSHTTGAEGSVGYSNFQTFDGRFYATTGLASNLAADVAVLYHDQGKGWGTNLATGHQVYKNRDFSIAAKIKWTPTDTTTVTLRGLHDHTNSTIGVGTAIYPGTVGTDGSVYVGKYNINSRFDPYNYSTQNNLGLRIEQEMGFATLVSLTGYTHLNSNFLANSGGVLGTLVPGQSESDLHNYGSSNTYTQELQLQSAHGSALQWIIGGFYMHDHFHIVSDVTPTCINGVCNPAPASVPIRSIGDQTLQSYAAFADATLTIAHSTRITGGVRYTKDDKDDSGAHRYPIAGYSDSVAVLAAPNFFGDVGSGAGPQASFSKVTFRAVLAHDFAPNTMAYASFNRGFKAGAYNPTVFGNPVVNPEVLDAFEIGLKSELFDRKLRFNASGFYYDYKNIQLRSFASAGAGQAILLNAAEAHIKGIDADAIFAPTRFLTFNASMTLLDAKFSSFPHGPASRALPITATGLGGVVSVLPPPDLTGFTVPNAPKFSGTIGATLTMPSSVGEFTFNANDTHNSGYFWAVDDRLRQAAYDQVNLTLGWTSTSGGINAQVYVHNLNKPYYFLRTTEAASGSDSFSPGDPRTFGAKVGFKF